MRYSIGFICVLALVFGVAVLLASCGETLGPVTTCGEGTQDVNGECVTVLVCGEGTTNVDNVCVPFPGAACGEGTEDVDGVCVPSESACTEGTYLDPDFGACVPDFEVICGAGTIAGPDGACVPDSGGTGGTSGTAGSGGTAGSSGEAGSGGTAGTAGTGGGASSCVEVNIPGEAQLAGTLRISPTVATFDDVMTVTVDVDADTREVTALLRNASSDVLGGSGVVSTSGNETVEVNVRVETIAQPGPHTLNIELRGDPPSPLDYILYTPGDGDTYVRIKFENNVPGTETATTCLEVKANIE